MDGKVNQFHSDFEHFFPIFCQFLSFFFVHFEFFSSTWFINAYQRISPKCAIVPGRRFCHGHFAWKVQCEFEAWRLVYLEWSMPRKKCINFASCVAFKAICIFAILQFSPGFTSHLLNKIRNIFWNCHATSVSHKNWFLFKPGC